MTNYRLFAASTQPSTATSYGGDIVTGLMFAVAGGGNWLNGYYVWCAGGATPSSTTSPKMALWCLPSNGSTGSAVLVPNSMVAAGALTMTPNAWNFLPLASPIQLAPGHDSNNAENGSAYIVAAGINGNFVDTNNMYGTGDPYANGVSSGPVHAYGATSNGPYGINSSGLFTTGGTDPTVICPGQIDGTFDDFGLDVQISTTAPSGYSGSYRLWPNKFDTNRATGGDSSVAFTLATEISLTASATLNNVHYYIPPGASTAAGLATRVDVWNISTGLSVASITSPSWTDEFGNPLTNASVNTPLGFWAKAAFAGGTTLPAGDYRVSVYNANGGSGSWNSQDGGSDYWGDTLSGAGSSGINWGIIKAPGFASASAGFLYASGSPGSTPPFSSGTVAHAQPPFGQSPTGAVIFPQVWATATGGPNETQNYWVDLEVTPVAAAAAPKSLLLASYL